MGGGHHPGGPVHGSAEVVAVAVVRPNRCALPCEPANHPVRPTARRREPVVPRAARSASGAVGKAACRPSPVVFTTNPAWTSTAVRRIWSWRASADVMASACSSQRRGRTLQVGEEECHGPRWRKRRLDGDARGRRRGARRPEVPNRAPSSATASPLELPQRRAGFDPELLSQHVAHSRVRAAGPRLGDPSDTAPASALPTGARGTPTRAPRPRAHPRAPRARRGSAARRPAPRSPSTAAHRDVQPRRERSRQTRTRRTPALARAAAPRRAPGRCRGASPWCRSACASTSRPSNRDTSKVTADRRAPRSRASESRRRRPTQSREEHATGTPASAPRRRRSAAAGRPKAVRSGDPPRPRRSRSTRSAATTNRICGLPSSSSCPFAATSSGPNTPKVTSELRLAMARSSHARCGRRIGTAAERAHRAAVPVSPLV